MSDKDLIEKIEKDVSWDDGQLGSSEEHAIPVQFNEAIHQAIIESAKLRLISIRLEEELIADLKMIAHHHGLSYQPLVRQLLKRFVIAEKKIMSQRARAMEVKGPDHADDGHCDEELRHFG